MARRSVLKGLSSGMKRKATNSLNQAGYMLMWGEEPPKKKKRVGKKK
jgi:hypothetical protein